MNSVGLVLGKFLPPHRGHVYLCEFARARVDRLHVVVGTLEAEPIPGDLRYAWMRELVPGANVIHLTDENPQAPEEHPEFWRIWRESLLRVLPEPVTHVFASEPYGERLAAELGARFVPVDPGREAWPVSGTAIREDPLGHWAAIPRVVRPHYVRRVSVFGPESCGKTTLAKDLAGRFGTCWVPEYARGYLELRGGEVALTDMAPIATGQATAERCLARDADRVLICDTDPLLTVAWSEALFGEVPDSVAAEAEAARYDLTLLLRPDVPFVDDPVRYLPGERERFYERCVALLDDAGRDYVVIEGDWAQRKTAAEAAVSHLHQSLR